jgi:GNAT superfamily N-acetyltransferase
VPSVTAIRELAPRDEPRWRQLWAAYLDFYEHPLPEETTAVTWRRLVDGRDGFRALVAVDEADQPLGFAHLLLHPTTWSVRPSCYLEDLVVDPSMRGEGIGRQLLEAVVEQARAEGADDVHWITQADNRVARGLYDAVATLTGYVRYEVELEEGTGPATTTGAST